MLQLDPPALLILPDPISTNGLFANLPGRGRVLTKDYREWRVRCGKILAAQHPLPRFAQPVWMTFLVGEKYTGQMDTDNAFKAYTDALVKAEVIPDDKRRWVRRTALQWVPGMGGALVKIEPAKMELSAAKLREIVKPGLLELLR